MLYPQSLIDILENSRLACSAHSAVIKIADYVDHQLQWFSFMRNKPMVLCDKTISSRKVREDYYNKPELKTPC